MKAPPNVQKLMDKAKIGLMQKKDSAFFTTIVFSLKIVWDDTQPTAYTNGTTIGFNSGFFLSMSPEERIGVLVHEAQHVAYLHIDRLQQHDHKIFNAAADHVINLQLLSRSFSLPSFRLADPRFTGMGTEQVYNILLEEKKQGAPQEANGMEDLRESSMSSPDLKRHVDDILVRAAVHSRMRNDQAGTIPGDIELYLQKLLNPKLPWTTLLRRYVQSFDKNDYSWKKPNRRFFPEYHLPSMWSEGLIDLEAWVDISGSETDEDFCRYISELAGVFRMMAPRKITLGQFDECIQSIDEVRNIHELKNVKFHGRGGTVITEVLDRITRIRPKLTLIFTDGGFCMDRESCPANIIWMIHDNPDWTAPFGKVVHFNTHD